ncbi:cytochrome c-type biogenesis protein CcmH [Sneathiella litorea]|uniref:Cytochrome c-type biogenesis protein n=1 Tax=Sneathiella litorea TaxID=2606216 RepID=A0A6L8W4U1_9PROT|nr:cytochrome c-type biogenesis protein CcmH [Sneathiella litorea]
MKVLARPLILAALLVPFIVLSSSAIFIEENLKDPALESRVRAISAEIRCLVCQNQSILDSNADLAKDLRLIVRERVALGDTDQEVRRYLVDRYGDWVLLDPPFKLTTVLLWLGPVMIFIFGAIAMVIFLRGRSHASKEDVVVKLSTEEEMEINRILDSDSRG